MLRYNIMFVLAHALATFGAYALARQLGAGRIGAAVAGVALRVRAVAAGPGRAPARALQRRHRAGAGHAGPRARLVAAARLPPASAGTPGWAYAGWLVAAWQISLGFGIGLPFAYVLAGIVLVAAVVWFARRWLVRPVPATVRRPAARSPTWSAALLFAAVGALLACPTSRSPSCTRTPSATIGDIGIYSPPVQRLLHRAGRVADLGRPARGGRGPRCPGTRR